MNHQDVHAPRILSREELIAILGQPQAADMAGFDRILALWNLAAHPDALAIIQSSFNRRPDLCDLGVSLDDSSAASSTMAAVGYNETEKGTWGTTTSVNDLRGPEVHLPSSWTIAIYDRNHQAGDTVWFRAWNNESKDFCEYEDTEIIDFVRTEIKRDMYSCFYVKTVGGDGHATVSLFEPHLVVRALTTVLDQAKRLDGIFIPKKEEVRKQHLMQKEKRGFFAFLGFGATARSAGKW